MESRAGTDLVFMDVEQPMANIAQRNINGCPSHTSLWNNRSRHQFRKTEDLCMYESMTEVRLNTTALLILTMVQRVS